MKGSMREQGDGWERCSPTERKRLHEIVHYFVQKIGGIEKVLCGPYVYYWENNTVLVSIACDLTVRLESISFDDMPKGILPMVFGGINDIRAQVPIENNQPLCLVFSRKDAETSRPFFWSTTIRNRKVYYTHTFRREDDYLAYKWPDKKIVGTVSSNFRSDFVVWSDKVEMDLRLYEILSRPWSHWINLAKRRRNQRLKKK